MWRRGNPFALWVGIQTGAVTVESNTEIPQEIRTVSAFGPSNPTSGNISEGTPNTNNSKELMPPMFIVALFIIAKGWKQPKCPSVNEWVKKLWYIYTKE